MVKVLILVFLLSGAAAASGFLGFDRNEYPGDENLAALRPTFSFAGFWLNNPPGTKSNSWTGKRAAVHSAGFGFLVLFNGRLYVQLKNEGNAARLGRADALARWLAAWREGFPARTIIFLDQEEGGRMLPEQKAYIYAWVDGVTAAGFRAGIYCSGMAAKEGSGSSVVTADDIRANAGGRKIVYFVTNDGCPPSPGCAFPAQPASPRESGVPFAEVWQFAQSPRRRDVAKACRASYAHDGNCYPPGLSVHVDLDAAAGADPSEGRDRVARPRKR